MSFLLLPKDQSVKDVAEKLGVPVEELNRHAKVKNPNTPLISPKRIEVPDGFLRRKPSNPLATPTHIMPSVPLGGMNSVMALKVEQERTRLSGGMHAQLGSDEEHQALYEALRTYLRLSAEDNDLAIRLLAQSSSTKSTDIRAESFALQACAYALKSLLFGEKGEPARSQALSSAKAALLADPKLALAHVGMGMAKQINADKLERLDAQQSISRALELDKLNVWAWTELAHLYCAQGKLEEAEQAIGSALRLAPDWVLALEIAANLSFHKQEPRRAITQLTEATSSVDTYANAPLKLAWLYKQLGQNPVAEKWLKIAKERCSSDKHALYLDLLFDQRDFPIRLFA